MPSAMGERTALCAHMKRTDCTRLPPASGAMHLALPVQREDEGEKPARGVEIHLDLAGEALPQQLRRLVVQPAPAHVDGFDLRRRGRADGRVVALADEPVVLDDAAERC